MRSWYDIYMDEIVSAGGQTSYILEKVKNKRRLIDLVLLKACKKDKILEAGCGTGVISTYLAGQGYNVTGMDIDNDILRLANDISKKYLSESFPKFEKGSIFEINYPSKHFKISFSSGVLEHFSDSMIVKSIKLQLKVAEYVVVSIPTSYFDEVEALHGDERFLSIKKWRELIKCSEGKILKESYSHFLKFPYHYLNMKKWFRPWPYKNFLITKR